MAELYVFFEAAMFISFWKILRNFLISGPLLLALGCARIITPDLGDGTQLSGVVQLARVSGALIRVYALLEDGSKGSLLAEAMTNAEGEYTVSLASYSGHVLIESTGGTYQDEATGDTKAASTLSAIVHSSAASDAAISPMSTLVKERLVTLVQGSSIEAAKTVAMTEVSRLFGVLPEDLTVLPTSATALVATDAKATRAAMAIAAFSYFLNEFRSDGSAVTVSDALDALSGDLKDDGKLNGSTSSTIAKSIAIQWTSAMTAARGLAAANSSLVFSRVSSQISESLSSTSIDTGSSLDGLQEDGSFFINGVNTGLVNGTGSFLGKHYYFGNLTLITDGLMDDGFYYQNGEKAQGLWYDAFYINGTQTSLNNYGTGSWNGYYYIGGTQTTLNNYGYGWWEGFYYVNGEATTLGSNGYGVWNGIYYVDGFETTLDSNGTGPWQNGPYRYYMWGFETTLDSNGTGFWDRYYYIGGTQTSLPENGTGSWNGYHYIGGTQTTLDSSGTGLWHDTFYINGQATSLDGNGNGTFNDVLYLSASPFTGVSDGTVGESGKYYSQGRLVESATYQGVVYYWGNPWTGMGDGIVGDLGKLYQNGVPFTGTGTGNFGEWNKYYFNGVIANGDVNGDLYVDGILIPACAGDCYLEGTAPDYAQSLMNGTIRRGPDNTVMVLQQNGMSGFKVWVEQNGNRILNATGLISKGWQKALTRLGTAFSNSNFTDTASIAGRVCPSEVFISREHPLESNRCLYYTQRGPQIALNAAETGGVYGEDFLKDPMASESGNGTSGSWYEGNIKSCADKGMRLPVFYEVSNGDPGSPYRPTDWNPSFSSTQLVPSSVLFDLNLVGLGGACSWTASTWFDYSYPGVSRGYLSGGGAGVDCPYPLWYDEEQYNSVVVCVLPSN